MKKAIGKACFALAGAVVLLSASPAGAAETGPTSAGLVPGPLHSSPVVPQSSRMLLDLPDGTLPADCLTPFVFDMARALRAGGGAAPAPAVPFLAAPPPLSEASVWTTPEGRVTVHYTTQRASADAVPTADLDRDGLSDAVEIAGQSAAEVLRTAEERGWLVPFTPSNRLDVYLANLAGATRGYYIPAGAAKGFAVVDSRLFADPSLLSAVSAHQAAHAILSGYDLAEPLWWHEGTASFLEVLALGSVARHADAMERFLSAPEKGLLPDDPDRGSWGLLWASFLSESLGSADVVRQIWDEEALIEGNNFLEVTERVLSRRGGSLAGAFAEFTRWNLFTGLRDDRQHYSFGGLLADPHAGTVNSLFPAGATATTAPLGWTVIRLEPDGAGGGLRVGFEGDETGAWEVDLLLASRRGVTSYRRVSLPVDGSGRASLGVPWGDAAEALLIIRNLRTSGPASSFTWSARPAPSYPYELGSLSADAEAGQVSINWETESEENLAAWDVYRNEGRGGFTRITETSIPAVGGADGIVGYQFVDTVVRPGAVYQYYVVGLTTDGLAQRSFTVTTRVPR